MPDWDYAVDVLRDIYKHRDDAYEKAYRGATWFNKYHGPKVAARKMLKELDRVGAAVPLGGEELDSPPLGLLRDVAQMVRVPNFSRLEAYAAYNKFPCSRRHVLLGQQIVSMTNDQVRYVVDYILNQGAGSVTFVAPSVYTPVGTYTGRMWRLEELQHTLREMNVPVLKYVSDRLWTVAHVRPPNGNRLQAFGSVIDRRWKPT